MRLTALCLVLLAAWAGPIQADDEFRDCDECPLMVPLPAGTYDMGSSEKDIAWALGLSARHRDVTHEAPQHKVGVGAFALSKTEVTRDQFEAFVEATGHKTDTSCRVYGKTERMVVASEGGNWRNPGFPQTGNHPVVCVSWNDAKAFVHWLSGLTGKAYRLPTEAEWEYAARAGEISPSTWGNSVERACRSSNVADTTDVNPALWEPSERFPCVDRYAHTAHVGQFRSNAFGLKDMIGNVWEWTQDCFNASYAGAPANGDAWLQGDCSMRVVRGGSWLSAQWKLRSTTRDAHELPLRSNLVGFRIARAL